MLGTRLRPPLPLEPARVGGAVGGVAVLHLRLRLRPTWHLRLRRGREFGLCRLERVQPAPQARAAQLQPPRRTLTAVGSRLALALALALACSLRRLCPPPLALYRAVHERHLRLECHVQGLAHLAAPSVSGGRRLTRGVVRAA